MHKVLPTIEVLLKSTGALARINESDYCEERHTLLAEAPPKALVAAGISTGAPESEKISAKPKDAKPVSSNPEPKPDAKPEKKV